MASASVLPRPSPKRLFPPQPSPATLTRSPVLPSVTYSIMSSFAEVIQTKPAPLATAHTRPRMLSCRWWPAVGESATARTDVQDNHTASIETGGGFDNELA